MEKENLSVNLLGDKGKNATDALLFWALYIGRLLVILTEAVALLVFFSRFSIDRRLIDLSDSIKQQQAYVSNFRQSEENFRNTQLKLSVSKSANTSATKLVSLFEELMRRTNGQVEYTSLSITPDALSITLKGNSVQELSEFIQQLKTHPSVATMSIDRVESKPKSSVINITVSIKLNKQVTTITK